MRELNGLARLREGLDQKPGRKPTVNIKKRNASDIMRATVYIDQNEQPVEAKQPAKRRRISADQALILQQN